MNDPKDNSQNGTAPAEPIEAPKGLDLRPHQGNVVRISRRVGMAIVGLALLLASAYVYDGRHRQLQAQTAAHEPVNSKAAGPATAAASEFDRSGSGRAGEPSPGTGDYRLHAPGTQAPANAQPSGTSGCGFDPRTGDAYRFDPQTGAPCAGPQDRIVVRQAPASRAPSPPASPQPNPEEQRIALAYQRERAAMTAPTGIGGTNGGPANFSTISAAPTAPDDSNRIAALGQAVAARSPDANSPAEIRRVLMPNPSAGNDSDYDAQNMQARKSAFLTAAQSDKTDDYLHSTRTAPLGAYEIKAGWEIPAVLEQSLNSDLPGDLKALVMSNVYDTATGRSLLIPQGSRLIGRYDSHVSYGQDGVQVVWNRIIYPDSSSIDISGMVGLDAHGNAGLRDEVDRHYKRLFGFSALTSLFSAAFDLSQRQAAGVGTGLVYPSVGDTASAAVGREVSQTGAQITRRNLDVQPTIKVPAGYKFTVRVNRDILFDAPYQRLDASPAPEAPGQLHKRTSFTNTGFNPKQ